MKNSINPAVVSTIAQQISKFYPQFDKKEFLKVASKLPALDLKARVIAVAEELKKHLPESYSKSIQIINQVVASDQLEGFALWPFSEYISKYGILDFDLSMLAMHLLTQKFTSEFAVRPFFIHDSKKVLKYFKTWTKDENHHVRRWVSEGSRPLLPWGMRLPQFVTDPSDTLILLEQLKYDEELYVRKSVANHLNDISKHHPKLVIETISRWEKNAPTKHQPKMIWIKRQALRTLIKKGNPEALKLMGVKGDAKIKMSPILLNQSKFKIGDQLQFSFEITSTAKTKQKLVVDYLIHFMKSNGSAKPKVYKLKTLELMPNQKQKIDKSHSLKLITTMVYYPGMHRISIQVNGKIFSEKNWLFDCLGKK